MSLHNPFPPRGEPDPIDVFLFFWVPFGVFFVAPIIALIYYLVVK